ncbi:hypothetical protein, partial [Trebonia sp.]|uniref:hypothetical protein n=1 Tax=Trebonia sp. TaxID=2767075 RepID=UPI002617D320
MTLTLMILTWALPLCSAIVPWTGASGGRTGVALAAAGAGSLAAAIALAVSVVSGHPLNVLGGFVYVDSLSAFFVCTVALVVTLAGIGSYSYLRTEEERRELSQLQMRLYGTFFGLFAGLMLAALQTG